MYIFFIGLQVTNASFPPQTPHRLTPRRGQPRRRFPLSYKKAGFSKKRLKRRVVLTNMAVPGILRPILLEHTERL
jgi:hypothetical protein